MGDESDARSPSTRRQILKVVGCAVGFLGLGATSAQAKASQSSVAYRGSPNGRERCGNCTYFEAPNSCSEVSGSVSPRGWCDIWSG